MITFPVWQVRLRVRNTTASPLANCDPNQEHRWYIVVPRYDSALTIVVRPEESQASIHPLFGYLQKGQANCCLLYAAMDHLRDSVSSAGPINEVIDLLHGGANYLKRFINR